MTGLKSSTLIVCGLLASACGLDEQQQSAELDGPETIGWVDGVTESGQNGYVNGWACSPGVADSIRAHVWLDGPAGSGTTFLAEGVADQPSEAAIAQACGAGGNHRFSIPVSHEQLAAYARRKLFVHGMSPIGSDNHLLSNSGNVSIPTFVGPTIHNGIVVDTSLHTSQLESHYKYGYAPSILKIDGTYHMWYCSEPYEFSPNVQAGMDSIRYVTSPDGQSWSTPQQVMWVTALQSERSNCDPAVVSWQGNYYLFYGGNRVGTAGVMFVARSATPQGPWAKWTERGTWEVNAPDPRAIITPLHGVLESDINVFYGLGQPTVVVKDGQLHMWFYDDTACYVAGSAYVNPNVPAPNGGPSATPLAEHDRTCGDNRYAVSSTDPTSWPAATRSNLPAEVVTWDDEAKRYHAVQVAAAHNELANLSVSYSTDGIRWSALAKIADLEQYSNNIGIATDARGFLLDRGVEHVFYGTPHGFNNTPSYGKWDIAATTAFAGVPIVGDFDGDHRADPAMLDPWNGTFYAGNIQQPLVVNAAHHRIATGDFNGDGVTDRLVVDDSVPGGSAWYVLDGRTGTCGVPEIPCGWQWGGLGAENRLALGDYDGDHKTDRAALLEDVGGTRWMIIPSSLGYGGVGVPGTPWGWQWGGMTADNELALGDYDGDGKTDKAIIDRDLTFMVIASSSGAGGVGTAEIPWGVRFNPQWGIPSTARLALGDYDGDGKTDRAVVDDSNPAGTRWYVVASSQPWEGVGTAAVPWGWTWGGTGPDTRLVVADYDGDGKTDPAVVTRSCRFAVGGGATASGWQLPAQSCLATP